MKPTLKNIVTSMALSAGAASLRYERAGKQGTEMRLPNSGFSPAASRVTALARQAPRHSGRGLGVRWTDSDNDFPDSGFGRIFLGIQ